MFTLITGQYAHGAGTVNEIMARAITQPPPSLGSVQRGAEPALVAFVDRAMAYLPKDRFQAAQEMQHALRELYHTLDGRRAVRPVQPSAPDLGGVPSSDASVQVVAAAASAPSPVSAPSLDASGVVAAPNATLTTGRAVVTSSDSQVVPKPGLPKWLPLAAGGAVLAIGVLVLALSGGEEESASASGASTSAPLPPPPAVPSVTPSIAADAPAPPPPSARTVDLESLPTLKSTTPAAAAPPPGKPPVNLLDAINPNKPVSPPAAPAPAPKPAPDKPPPNLFKKRQ
jgi:hypothetical protein